MRMLLRIQMDVEAGNGAIKDGSFGETLDRRDGADQTLTPDDVRKGLEEASKAF